MSYDAENRNNRFVCPLLTSNGLNNYLTTNINHINFESQYEYYEYKIKNY